MARLTRKNIKVFADSASNNGVFGSLQAGNPTVSNDVETLQSLTAWNYGWNSATMTSEKLPPLEEIQGVTYVTTYQQAYLMQEGMPEWAATVTYYKGSLVKKVTTTGFQIYNSLTNNNLNHQLSDTSNWKLVMDSDNLYAFDSAVVHIAGAETITGAKTFSGNLIKTMGTSANGVKVQCVDLVKGTPPTSEQGNVYGQFTFQDNGGTDLEHRFGGIEVSYKPDGTITAQLEAVQPVANSTTYEKIAVTYPASGSAYTYAPAPSLASNASGYANQIVTVGYLEGSSAGVVHTSGNETIGGNKTFTGTSTFTGDAVYNSRLQMLYDTAGTNGVFIQNTAITKGTTPTSATESAARLVFNGAGGSTVNYRIGSFETGYYDDGSIQTFMRAYKPTANNNTNAVLGLVYPASGNPYGTAPASDVNGSIVTTKSHANNYVEFGNGYILQKGTFTYASSSGTVDVPLDKTMTTTDYAVIVMMEGTVRNDMGAVTARATNKFTFKSNQYSGTGNAMYIVFGK